MKSHEHIELKVLKAVPLRSSEALPEVQQAFNVELPSIIKTMLSRNGYGKGQGDSNCWNTTLKVLGEDVPWRWENERDMDAWLKENTKKIRSNHAKPGDVVSFYSDSILYHTLIYLGKVKDDVIVFHKDASGPFEFTTLTRALEGAWGGKYTYCSIYYHRPVKQNAVKLLPVQAELNLFAEE